MNIAASYLPAWLLQCLPVGLARKFAQAKRHQSSDETQNSSKIEKQLLIDVSVVYQNDARTGIQRVVRALLIQLLAAPPSGYRIRPIFATRLHPYTYAQADFLTEPRQPQASDSREQPELVRVNRDDIFLALDLAAHLLPHHKNQVLRWKRDGVHIHVVVYDLLPLQHPEWFNSKTIRNFKRWFAWLIIYADSALCISNTVKTELQIWIGAHYSMCKNYLPINTFVLGANIEATAPSEGVPSSAELLLARLRTTPAVLMVGTLEPRKGYDQALAAFEILWKNNQSAPLLVIVGRPGWKTEELQKTIRLHPQIEKRLFWIEDASDEFLERLYNACRGVLIASKAEGFGLPLFEAAMKNRPVLARDLPVFKEHQISNVNYFKSGTIEDLALILDSWIQNELKKFDTHSRNIRTVILKPPTWDQSANQLLTALGIAMPVTTSVIKNTNSRI